MMRRVAVVGDQLDTGGQIEPYAGSVCTWGDAGHQVALIGGEAYCEACRSVGSIAKSGGPRRIQFMGETAADGDIVLCKCASPPRIVAKLAGESWCDDMAESMGTVIFGRAGGGAASVVVGAYDEQVRAVGRGAFEGYPYFIETEDGRTHAGRIDASCHLPRIYTDSGDDYTVHWGDEALVRQNGI
jgi:hypothetical protein